MAAQSPANVARLDGLLVTLRTNGGRITTPRRAILKALIEGPGHPTAEQLTARVQKALPDVHESTVYRFLEDLEGLGIIDHVHLGHGPAVYHFADDAHHHLVCEVCDAVLEVPTGAFEALRRRLLADFDFELRPRHFAVPGRCRGCGDARR